MVFELYVGGIPTITTVNSPMNDYVLNKNLRCKTKLFKKEFSIQRKNKACTLKRTPQKV